MQTFIAGLLSRGAPFGAVFCFERGGKRIQFTLASDDAYSNIDVREIAKLYGGAGPNKNEATFTIPFDHFKPNEI